MKPTKGNRNNDTGKSRRDRYWSVMLVGEHGRITPLRWFKGALITFIGVLLLATTAAIVLGVQYKRQLRRIDRLQAELQEVRQQAAKLRDEKDLYLTQYVASQKSDMPAVRKELPPVPEKAMTTEPAKEASAAPVSTPSKAPPPEAPKPLPVKAPVEWKADIRKFDVTYDPDRKVLKAEFRIYNTSRPKEALSGRTVVVFKKMDTPPLNWFPVPHVPIRDGKPEGARGQAFKINNYRTVAFRAYQQEAPIEYDIASVFIFSSDGALITERDFPFRIDYTPPVSPQPAEESRTTQVDQAPANETPPAPDPPAKPVAEENQTVPPSAPPPVQETVGKMPQAAPADKADPPQSLPSPVTNSNTEGEPQ